MNLHFSWSKLVGTNIFVGPRRSALILLATYLFYFPCFLSFHGLGRLVLFSSNINICMSLDSCTFDSVGSWECWRTKRWQTTSLPTIDSLTTFFNSHQVHGGRTRDLEQFSKGQVTKADIIVYFRILTSIFRQKKINSNQRYYSCKDFCEFEIWTRFVKVIILIKKGTLFPKWWTADPGSRMG